MDKLIEKVVDKLKLHERQIVNVGSHDEEEARRRRGVRYETARQTIPIIAEEIKNKIENYGHNIGINTRDPAKTAYIFTIPTDEWLDIFKFGKPKEG